MAYSPTDSLLYVAAEGSVQPYDLTFATAGSSIADLAGIQNYMNLGPTGALTYSTISSGLRNQSLSTGLTPDGGFGPAQATSLSRIATIGGTDYRVFYDRSDSSVKLTTAGPGFAGTTTTIFTLAGSGLSDIAAVDFAFTGSTTGSSFFFAASSAGEIREYSLAGTATGNTGNLNLISGGSLVALSYNDGFLSYASYDINAGDFGASQMNFGTFTGTAIPEPSTCAALAALGAGLAVALKRRRQ